ncbi:LRAT domain [Dillenia turbinata]|uniref:LRAT domain n=1 Tax=Dillenia turbinata TaxID=194707 RepID=A0AAN8ZQK8_9MAGN
MVIHYTRTEEGGKESSSSKTCLVCHYRSDLHRGVVKTCLDCFLAGQDQIYWYEYGVSGSEASSFPVGSYSTRQSRPPSEVVDCASQLLDSGFKDYSLFSNNCEDFAHLCKTGDPKSSQADYVTKSLWSLTQNIIKLASEMGCFGPGGLAGAGKPPTKRINNVDNSRGREIRGDPHGERERERERGKRRLVRIMKESLEAYVKSWVSGALDKAATRGSLPLDWFCTTFHPSFFTIPMVTTRCNTNLQGLMEQIMKKMHG